MHGAGDCRWRRHWVPYTHMPWRERENPRLHASLIRLAFPLLSATICGPYSHLTGGGATSLSSPAFHQTLVFTPFILHFPPIKRSLLCMMILNLQAGTAGKLAFRLRLSQKGSREHALFRLLATMVAPCRLDQMHLCVGSTERISTLTPWDSPLRNDHMVCNVDKFLMFSPQRWNLWVNASQREINGGRARIGLSEGSAPSVLLLRDHEMRITHPDCGDARTNFWN